MPGAVANNFAQSHARSHDDRVLTERECAQFGQDLLLRVLARRQYWLGKDRPDLALNLPVKDIQSAHYASFVKVRIHPNAWTPRQLPVAPIRHDRMEAADGGWHALLTTKPMGSGPGRG